MSFSYFQHAHAIVDDVKHQRQSASAFVECYLARIEHVNPRLNAYHSVLHTRARQRAEQLDERINRGDDPGPLAGLPFAVKNLFDVQGLTTLAGSKINVGSPPAQSDAVLIQRMEAAGAILLGTLSMGEYAYDFTGENAHYGHCANPWDTQCMSGGSSSGSGAATAAGIAPISLGSDTNGSIRVPASFCGVFGLKPTYGRLPRSGSFPFCDSLDHVGPMARCVEDLANVFDVLQGYDHGDHACVDTPPLKTGSQLQLGIENLKIKRATGYFSCDTTFPSASKATQKVCAALSANGDVDIPLAREGRSAAYVITNVEGSAFHLERLQTRPQDFDPDTRDRFLAGALLPASWYIRAQQVRQAFSREMRKVFLDTDILVAPATPVTAPKIGTRHLTIEGETQLLRPNLGYFTQPISAIGLPSVVVPTYDDETRMPIGVQIIAAPWREDLCLRVAHYLEQTGFCCNPPPI